jgi:hypothetical protein
MSAEVITRVAAGAGAILRNKESLRSVAALDEFDVIHGGTILIGATLDRVPRMSRVIKR